MERPADAAAAYQRQRDLFPESSSARHAETALDKLLAKHPELVPDEVPEPGDVAPEDGALTEVLSSADDDGATE